MYSYAATMRGYYGIYGEQWTDAQEGEVGINGEPAKFHLLTPWQESEPQQYCVLQMVTSFRDAAFRLGEPSDPSVDLYSGEGLETLLYQVTHDYKPFTTDEKIIPPIKFTEDENEEMSIIKQNLATTIKQEMIAFFNGTKSVETDYDAFLQTLEDQGLSKLVEFYQNAYDAQYK
jgi:putative aldouronate transport system substrate-binding protein